MWWLDLVFHYIGVAVVAAVAGIVLVVVSAAIFLIARMLTPRLHVGRPKNDGELCFYDPRVILANDRRHMVAAPLKIRWWAGLSKRNSSRWFIGVMRFDEGD